MISPVAAVADGFTMPAAESVPLLAAGVAPRSSGSANHVSGSVDGALTNYQDLNACAWFVGGGWDVRNGRRLKPRGLSGLEDTSERRR